MTNRIASRSQSTGCCGATKSCNRMEPVGNRLVQMFFPPSNSSYVCSSLPWWPNTVGTRLAIRYAVG